MRKIICLNLTKLTYNIIERIFMKKKLISLVTVSALMVGGLATLVACGKPNNPSGDQTSQNEGAKFSVSYKAGEGYTIEGLKESYAEGETVTFKVTVTDNTKQISAVRVAGSKISPDANGQYSFVMPGEDVRISVTLTDADSVSLSAFYSGNPMVGETLTITTKIDFAENNEFTVTAKTGATLVQINGHEVKLLAVGEVVLEITASKNGETLKTELKINIFENEAGLGQNIACVNEQIKNGAESLANDNPGSIIYWAGDGGSVSSFTYNAAKDEFDVRYSMGWAFYGVQIFYSLPYAEVNDNYKVRWEITSDAAGTITINSNRVTLNQGSTLVGLDITQGNGATISLQMGYHDGSDHPLETGSHLTFKPIRIYDTDTTHKYNRVQFSLEGETLKDIYVRNGKTVSAPEVQIPEGKIFTGFFDGETKYDEGVAPTKDTIYVAKFVNKTEENTAVATLMLGDKELTKVDVYKGNKIIIPTGLNYGFGQQLKSLYKDAAFTQPFDLNSAINEDVVLYVKTQIIYESTYVNDGGLGYKIPSEWTTLNDDGSITLKFKGWGSDQRWHIQANFTDSLIRGSLGETYTITFTYSINVEGAGAQVYDGNTLDSANLEVGNNLEASVSYEGGAHEGDFKLTFELGGIALDADVVFTLHTISIKKN